MTFKQTYRIKNHAARQIVYVILDYSVVKNVTVQNETDRKIKMITEPSKSIIVVARNFQYTFVIVSWF